MTPVGKKACTIEPSAALFGDPCSGKVKRLLVSLHCTTGTTPPPPPPTPPKPIDMHIEQMQWHDSITLNLGV
jgi:hypothetical protein